MTEMLKLAKENDQEISDNLQKLISRIDEINQTTEPTEQQAEQR